MIDRLTSRHGVCAAAIFAFVILLPIPGRADAAAPAATPGQRVDDIEAEYASRHAALAHEMETWFAALKAEIALLKSAGDADSPWRERERSPSGSAEPQLEVPLEFGGDFRLRYEHTTSHTGSRTRDRGVLRVRLAAAYAVNDRFTIGGRLTTGDPDDPNSADITMDDFVDDLAVSLDQAYARFRFKNLEVAGGKFANPFVNTELVWDGDVNPYGLGVGDTLYSGAGSTFRVAGIYSIVDEQIAASSSDMLGAQVSFDLEPTADWQFGFNAAYYDYEIGSLLAADRGDTRDNNLAPGGSAYLSDFDLLDFVVSLTYSPAEGWPLAIVGDYVRNLGAAVPEDSGWSFDFSLGALAEVGDWRFGYGYAVAETDAVLGAFSQDNTIYATNYRQHTLTADYLLFDGTHLNLTSYLYRREDFAFSNQLGDNDWLSRVRLNLQFSF